MKYRFAHMADSYLLTLKETCAIVEVMGRSHGERPSCFI